MVAFETIAGDRRTMSLGVPIGELDLASFLPYRLAVSSKRVSRALARRYETGFGVSIPEWRCLAVLGRRSQLTATDLGRRASLDKVQTSRALAGLVDRGLVARSRDDGDRRATRLALTDDGRALYADLAAVALAWERELIEALGLSDRRALDRVLHKLDRALDRLER
ncbi:MAG: MarR family winged helix-turn-helix transcriptional regulator [Pseudomonadota bacterium]